ncbi:uncharacterized protein LOC127252216 [Andrographis paniculata]|uniref:uncharacterized protein LOC127252216 n=1 Tax=Andrographis paniculata TaxID=175694 RepID=UPI0021E8C03B|nr:uncharacterized protein LOC127252216 [Andrographis paniculata]
MRCKRHPEDLSSGGGGVCASCLRERLCAVMAAQAQKEAQHHQAQLDRRKLDAQRPLPLSFPRSVSPYVSWRRSTSSAMSQLHGGAGTSAAVTVEVKAEEQKTKKKKKSSNVGKFSKMFLGLFRSKSDNSGPGSVPGSDTGASSGHSCTASPSWFSTVIPRRRRKQIRTLSLDDGGGAIGRRKISRNRDRGMSPARCSDDDDDDDGDDHCNGGLSGYTSESSPAWKQTPRMTPSTARRGGVRAASHSRSVSGLVFCLSPLVRASPTHHWNQIGLPPEIPMVGESRAPAKPHLSTATSFCKNRSRKLADFGRYH